MKLIAVLSLLLSFEIMAKSVPTVPSNCFKNGESFCINSEIVGSITSKRFIDVKAFAIMSKEDTSPATLKSTYLDFDSWSYYLSGANSVLMNDGDSRKLPSQTIGGRTYFRHLTNYKIRGPFGYISINETSRYSSLEKADTLMSFAFELEPGATKVGLKDKTGELHVITNPNNASEYLIYVTINVRPDVPDFVFDVAAPYVTTAMGEIVQRILDNAYEF